MVLLAAFVPRSLGEPPWDAAGLLSWRPRGYAVVEHLRLSRDLGMQVSPKAVGMGDELLLPLLSAPRW